MRILKKAAAVMTAVSLVTSSLAFAQQEAPANQTQHASDAITNTVLQLKARGNRIEDDKGTEIPVAQIAAGQTTSFTVYVNGVNNFKFRFKSNREDQSVAIALLTLDGQRLTARNLKLDPNISGKQNEIKMRQTVQSLITEYGVAKNGISKSDRLPASRDAVETGAAIALTLLAIGSLALTGLAAVICASTIKSKLPISIGLSCLVVLPAVAAMATSIALEAKMLWSW